MKILITNDDGINAPGIIRLAKVAKKYGEVWIVAPDSQRSGASHSINLHVPITVTKVSFPVEGVEAYQTSGTPADCARVGILSIVPDKPDLVLSGINYGHNAGSDVMYSGTVGAAMEAMFQGIAAIAISEGGCPGGDVVTEEYLEEILDEYVNRGYVEDEIININFPACDLSEVKGILHNRKLSRGRIFTDTYKCVREDGDTRDYMVSGQYGIISEPDTDLRAIHENYISIGIVKNMQ